MTYYVINTDFGDVHNKYEDLAFAEEVCNRLNRETPYYYLILNEFEYKNMLESGEYVLSNK